jgi:hypothetical protein
MDHTDNSKEGMMTGRLRKRVVWMVVIVDEKSATSSKNQVPSALSKRDESLNISTQKDSEGPAETQGLDEKQIH